MSYKDKGGDYFDPTNPNRLIKVGIAINGAAIYRRAETGELHQEYRGRDWWGKQNDLDSSSSDERKQLGFTR